MKILIAEDDPATRIMLEKKLMEMEYTVCSYCNGRDALEALQEEETTDIAIIDWEMPEMNGLELIDLIRADRSLRSMYVIMLTIRDRDRDVMESFQIGVDDYLSKPLNLKELRIGLEKGRRIIRSGMDFDERQDIIMDNIYDFFEGKGRFGGS
jgi:DNA-binding response OmpR family regulator